MRASRFLLLIGCVSCAEISGLNELGVDASGLDAADAGDASPTIDAMSEADVPRTFCQTTTTTYTFCADFDEGDVTKGYVSPTMMASWSSVSTPPPTLSTAFVSSPAAAQFDGDVAEAFGLIQSASSKVPTSASATFSLRIDMLASFTSPVVVTLPIDDNQSVALIAVNSAQTYKLALSDTSTATDGGLRQTTYTDALDMKPGEWHSIALGVSTTQISLAIDGGPPTLDPRVSSGPLSALQFHLGMLGKGWQGSADNVTILIND